MLQVDQANPRDIVLPGLNTPGRRLGALIGAAVAQSGFITVLLAVADPFRAIGVAVAIPAGVAVLLSPRIGLYLLALTLIGAWPWQIMRYAGMLAAAAAVAWLLRHRKRLLPPNPILILVGVYTVFVIASTISPKTHVGVRSAALTYVGYFALVWLCVTLIDSRRALRIVVGLCVISGVVTALLGLVQAYTHFIWPVSTLSLALGLEINQEHDPLELQGWAGRFRIDSITGTPDFLPLYMQTLMPFVIFWTLRQHTWTRRLVGLLVLSLLGLAHVLSFTRGAMLTTAIVLLLTGWLIDRRRFIAFVPAFAVLVLLASLAWEPMRDRVISIITFGSLTGEKTLFLETGSWRLQTFPIAFKMLFESPILGMGIGQQRYNWPPSAWHLVPVGVNSLVPVHHSYLLAGIEVGLGGLAVLLLLMGMTVQRLYALAGRFHLMGEFELADTARASLMAFIGLAFAMFLYPMLDNFRYFWLLIGLTASLVHIEGLLCQTASDVELPTTALSPLVRISQVKPVLSK